MKAAIVLLTIAALVSAANEPILVGIIDSENVRFEYYGDKTEFCKEPARASVKIVITWEASTHLQNKTISYKVYRNGKHVLTTSSTEFVDNDVLYGVPYVYRISAICCGTGDGILESKKSEAALVLIR